MNNSKFDNKLSGPNLTFQPLYQQVAEYIKQLIIERRWVPGEALPSEFKLADEFNVSQGTVRKALTLLTDTKIVSRRQGVGTFVTERTAQDALFRFFPLQADGNGPELPKAELLDIKTLNASKDLQKVLNLDSSDKVFKLDRRRILKDEFCMIEYIYLPVKFFPDIEKEKDIPHTLYHYYQTEFNLTVRKTSDSIKAVICDDSTAKLLAIGAGEPLLQVDRITETIDDKLIEYRQSLCRSDHYHYQVELD